ncbi:unnamed protein product [Symbiodinium pilosum]|uniref:Uncharacterized protein n=1 Tax=Symbiodinium pilosum TaxID=2952 RepID=A0A812KV63_SYMPI|nr:unnamed protein product [Symbiodinium pilosum]
MVLRRQTKAVGQVSRHTHHAKSRHLSRAAALTPSVLSALILQSSWASNQQPHVRARAKLIISQLTIRDQLAFPSVPCHDWASEFQSLTFRRPMLHLILGSNKSFGLKLVDALWAAELGDLSRLRRYLHDPESAEEILRICRDVQRAEADASRRLRIMQPGNE